MTRCNKALAITAELLEDIMEKLTGNPVLDDPQWSEDMWTAVRAAHPASAEGRVASLERIPRDESDVKYLQRCKASKRSSLHLGRYLTFDSFSLCWMPLKLITTASESAG